MLENKEILRFKTDGCYVTGLPSDGGGDWALSRTGAVQVRALSKTSRFSLLGLEIALWHGSLF